ncbi:hypothetical protein [Adlercreutzia sp. ZJ138]|uniref:hypothetical protein n=1 Tax=Adlercreutzia sp. ZJ138 TaxID=2709405 RepID=UPI0013EA5B09|nr:hypothetical protein [Adlercreutzia sp. ZJ138]
MRSLNSNSEYFSLLDELRDSGTVNTVLVVSCLLRELMGSERQPEFYEEDSDCVVFGWDSIKWYDGLFADVTNVTDALDKLEEGGIPYEFCRIGESWEDIEFRTVGNNDELTMHVEPSVYIEVL